MLRADRGIANNGLEASSILDFRFVDYYMLIDPSLRTPQNGIEKWLLRESFKEGNYLPYEVLFRKKEAFSDGVSGEEKSWFEMIQDYSEEKYGSNYKNIIEKYNHCVPTSKESLYFRSEIFESKGFGTGNIDQIIPKFWLN